MFIRSLLCTNSNSKKGGPLKHGVIIYPVRAGLCPFWNSAAASTVTFMLDGMLEHFLMLFGHESIAQSLPEKFHPPV
jgi:hypothetical protein